MSHHLGPEIANEAGRLRLHGVAAALARWFDDQFRAMAVDHGAVECRFPATLGHHTLERAGFFAAFPGGAAALADAGGRGFFLCPAVCYHAYDLLAGTALEAPVTLTAVQTCVREADRAAGTATRLWEFTMREVIFAGAPEWVEARAAEWTHRITEFASGVGLASVIEPATDSFIGPAARGQRLIQQLKESKRELRLTVEGTAVAAASINLHDAHFSSRFGFSLVSGGPTHTACVAFGLERWTLAYLSQYGAAAAAELVTRAARG